MSNIGMALEAATREERARLVTHMAQSPECIPALYDEVIAEIGRRLRTMPVDVFVEAACDILRQSRIEPDRAEEAR
jgi:hypothetical protein